uniref:C2H2-type domain-containing protein n=1 Tax=Globodera rostochiensis TaxID=31243 RepID=A0A914I197_GLORO
MSGSKCKHCNLFIAGKKMHVHLETWNGTICGRRFPTVRGLGTHRGKFHTGEEKGAKFLCDINGCGFGTDKLRLLDAHQEKCRTGFLRRSRARSSSIPRMSSITRTSSIPRTVPTEEGVATLTAAAIADRRRSAVAVFRSSVVCRSGSRQSVTGATAPSRPASSANVQDNNDSPLVSPDAADGVPVSSFPAGIVDELGLYNLRLLDPATTRKIMYEQHKSLDDLMDGMQKELDTVKKIVAEHLPIADLTELEEFSKYYRQNLTADALEKSGRINLGIAERALSSEDHGSE